MKIFKRIKCKIKNLCFYLKRPKLLINNLIEKIKYDNRIFEYEIKNKN